MREHLARLDMHVAFWMTLLIGALACWYSFSFYQDKPARGWLAALRRRAARFEFTLDSLGGFSYFQLALVSVVGLFLELLMIRWISSEVRVFAYLKNYVLVSCFLGFGLGCYLCRKKINLIALLAPLFSLVFLIKFPWEPLRTLISALPSYLGAASEVHFFGIPTIPFSPLALLGLFAAVAITVPLFIIERHDFRAGRPDGGRVFGEGAARHSGLLGQYSRKPGGNSPVHIPLFVLTSPGRLVRDCRLARHGSLDQSLRAALGLRGGVRALSDLCQHRAGRKQPPILVSLSTPHPDPAGREWRTHLLST